MSSYDTKMAFQLPNADMFAVTAADKAAELERELGEASAFRLNTNDTIRDDPNQCRTLRPWECAKDDECAFIGGSCQPLPEDSNDTSWDNCLALYRPLYKDVVPHPKIVAFVESMHKRRATSKVVETVLIDEQKKKSQPKRSRRRRRSNTSKKKSSKPKKSRSRRRRSRSQPKKSSGKRSRSRRRR